MWPLFSHGVQEWNGICCKSDQGEKDCVVCQRQHGLGNRAVQYDHIRRLDDRKSLLFNKKFYHLYYNVARNAMRLYFMPLKCHRATWRLLLLNLVTFQLVSSMVSFFFFFPSTVTSDKCSNSCCYWSLFWYFGNCDESTYRYSVGHSGVAAAVAARRGAERRHSPLLVPVTNELNTLILFSSQNKI